MNNLRLQNKARIKEKMEIQDINSVFLQGADLKADKLQESATVTKLINDTIEKQIAVLKLNQMNQEDLRTVVQL